MKRVVLYLLFFSFIVGIFSGCGVYVNDTVPDPQPGPPPVVDAVEDDTEIPYKLADEVGHFGEDRSNKDESRKVNVKWPGLVKPMGSGEDATNMNNFNSSLIEYAKENGYGNKNFMISPLSLRVALILAVEGASGETREQLISALGFQSYDEMQDWYDGVLNGIEGFNDSYGKQSDWAYSIANSIWGNSSYISDFNRDYARDVSDKYDAEAIYADSGSINNEVSDWVNEKTNGFINQLDVDLSNVPATLINAIYLKSGWINVFNPNMTDKGFFYYCKWR